MLVERNCISLEQRCNNLVHLVVCLEHYTTVRGNRRSFQGKAVVAVKSTDRYLVGKLYHKTRMNQSVVIRIVAMVVRKYVHYV